MTVGAGKAVTQGDGCTTEGRLKPKKAWTLDTVSVMSSIMVDTLADGISRERHEMLRLYG